MNPGEGHQNAASPLRPRGLDISAAQQAIPRGAKGRPAASPRSKGGGREFSAPGHTGPNIGTPCHRIAGSVMFKTPTKHHQKAIDLAASASRFDQQVNDGLARRLAPVLENGETSPDFLFAQELVGRLLHAVGRNLKERDGAQTQQLVAASALRGERNRVAGELRELLRTARVMLDGVLDPATARTILPVRRVSNMRPDSLVKSGRDVVAALRNPNLGIEVEPGSVFDVKGIAKTVEEKSEELATLLGQLAPQARNTQAELEAKLAEIDNAADTHRRCADFLYGLYRLAGLDFHAARLRS
jgi:hypothetical protein